MDEFAMGLVAGVSAFKATRNAGLEPRARWVIWWFCGGNGPLIPASKGPTLGSIRRPAAFTGLVGMKQPTVRFVMAYIAFGSGLN